jgi:CheY-like chemotaxis protein
MPRDRPLVLVVDDEPVLLRLLEVNLRLAGLDVRTTASGREAVEVAAAHLPDAIVLDLGLPDLDGREVLARVRSDETTAATPVVVLSGADRDAANARGYAANVHAYLTKPVEPAEVVEAVRRALAGD